jgi:predicted lipoprotein with Yx(FWY)xxD motif
MNQAIAVLMRLTGLATVVAMVIAPGVALAASGTALKIGHLADGVNTPVVADANGLTLYMTTDDKNGRSSCNGSCLKGWKPLRAVGKLVASGLSPKLLGITLRKGGFRQVTYNRHPLYLYVHFRQRRGNYDGQGCSTPDGGTWWVLTPRGKPDTGLPPSGNCQSY